MAIERVREYFKQWGLENRIMEFDVSSATVELDTGNSSILPSMSYVLKNARTLSIDIS